MCFKKQILKEKRVAAIHREKRVLAILSSAEFQHPFIVTLYATFQDMEYLYFVLSYAEYGDLLHIMLKRPEKRFSLDDSRFYAAEVLSALQHIHSLSFVHRDVKPENLLVSASGHIMLSDFGSVKDLSRKEDFTAESTAKSKRKSSFVGTAQYVSPEVLEGGLVSPATDLWALGVVIYQFLTAFMKLIVIAGRHLFHDDSEYLIYKRIKKLLYSYPCDFPISAKDCVDSLLRIKAEDRLGAEKSGGPAAIRNHEFFTGIEWDNLPNTKPPPIQLFILYNVDLKIQETWNGKSYKKWVFNVVYLLFDFQSLTHYYVFDRWVYRPHGRWHRYLPRRNDSVKEFNYEAGGSLSEFKEEMANEVFCFTSFFFCFTVIVPKYNQPYCWDANFLEEANVSVPKLWMAWLYRDLSGEPYWTKKRVMNLFGTDFVVGRMEVFPNTSAFNEELWHIKHLIELKPITFPDGEPTSDDMFSMELHPDGRCRIAKVGAQVNVEQLKLTGLKKQWSPKELTSQLASKYYGCKDVFETNVYTNANISIVK
uniref:non-specific serine/threonine protein kinase n=1 Tax=Angiostrongylus cantonensis TaxID=6313 RepID=A0A0K0DMU7_ANGCA